MPTLPGAVTLIPGDLVDPGDASAAIPRGIWIARQRRACLAVADLAEANLERMPATGTMRWRLDMGAEAYAEDLKGRP